MKTNGKANYDCSECPAYCCSVYERVQVTKRDIQRLGKHFGVSEDIATKRYTKVYDKERVLRRQQDPILGEACAFLNLTTRRCGIYDARPNVCRKFPETPRCAYYDLLKFEHQQQGDPEALPVVKITFKSIHKAGKQ